MKKTLHILRSALVVRESLTFEQRKQNDILELYTNLSCVRLPKDYSDDELLKSVIEMGDFKLFDNFRKFVNHNFSKYEKIVVWHGDVAAELLMLYMICDLLPNDKLYEVDLKSIEELKPKFDETRNLDEKSYGVPSYYYCHMDEVSINMVCKYNLLNRVTKISDAQHKYFREQWNFWKHNKTCFILNAPDGSLQSYPDNFMDKEIIQKVSDGTSYRRLYTGVYFRLKKFGVIDDGVMMRIRKLIEDRKNAKLNVLIVRKPS